MGNILCQNMSTAGFKIVKSFNPYWDNSGKTFEDPEGYRVVLQNKTWDLKPKFNVSPDKFIIF